MRYYPASMLYGLRLLVLNTAGMITLAYAAGLWTVSADDSEISARFKQMGVPVSASFDRFEGHIQFDPAAPQNSSARITVDTASFDIGDEDYNAEVRKPEWLATEQYPQASFVSTSVSADAQGGFIAHGDFTLKGRTEARDIRFSTEADGDAQVFEGALTLSRKAYSIGDPDWNEVLEDEVVINFRVVATAD